jgi:hypothetical protein
MINRKNVKTLLLVGKVEIQHFDWEGQIIKTFIISQYLL